METRYHNMPMGPAESVPVSVLEPFYPGQEPSWICLATGQRRLALRRQIEENEASHGRAMKEYRAWRRRIYARSLKAIRLIDTKYLPMVEHPYRPGDFAFDLELPLRDREGDEALLFHVSNHPGHSFEDAIRTWFATLTRPMRASKAPNEYPDVHGEGEQVERVRVAEQYARKIFQEDLPLGQQAALIKAVFGCLWFDKPAASLRAYFERTMRKAVSRESRIPPLSPGGVPAISLDEPDPMDPTRTRGDAVPAQTEQEEDEEETEEAIDNWRSELWEFMRTIPTSRPKLLEMAHLVLECRDERAAIERYGDGGMPQLKRLRREVRVWREAREKPAS